MSDFRNIAIMASAGSGKTYSLAHHCIRLMLQGVAPDRICALTFSRKAAGEIFESILKYLTQAATDEQHAAQTSAQVGLTADRSDYLNCLRAFLNSIHRLAVGTIDSFMVKVIRTFPEELGLGTGFHLTDEHSEAGKALFYEALSEILHPQTEEAKKRMRLFCGQYDLATHGRQEKRLYEKLTSFILDYRQTFIHCHDEQAWGQPDRIWPNHPPWKRLTNDELAKTAEACLQQIDKEINHSKLKKGFCNTVLSCATMNEHSPESQLTVHSKIEPFLDQLHDGFSFTYYNKPVTVSHKLGRQLAALIGHAQRVLLDRSLQQTQGMCRLLSIFELLYWQHMQREGSMTYADVQYILAGSHPFGRCSGLTGQVNDANRLYIDYRLDSRVDHWLLDEFQDTSDSQWQVLENLIDEAVSDPDRSLFYVGDVKQAIYGWRGGNAELFSEVYARYTQNPGDDGIEMQHLQDSYRSCPPVINCVNQIFGRKLPAEISASVRARWEDSGEQAIWQEHRCSEHTAGLAGYVCLLQHPDRHADKGRNKDSYLTEDRHEVVCRILSETRPDRRGWSCAILVRNNAAGKELADYLRQHAADIPVVNECGAVLSDSPAVRLMISLIRFSRCPGDTMSHEHLRMSPLNKALSALAPDPQQLPGQLLSHIQDHGFADFIQHWSDQLEQIEPLTEFDRLRISQLLDMACAQEQQDQRDPRIFLRDYQDFRLDETADVNAVRIMTIHKSKGLGFDMVILPTLHESRSILKIREMACLKSPPEQADPWLVMQPPRACVEQDPVLAAAEQHMNDKAAFENLCNIYVALTRAKRAVYMVSHYKELKSSYTSGHFITQQLAGSPAATTDETRPIDGLAVQHLYADGEPQWYTEEAVHTQADPAQDKRGKIGRPHTGLERIEPSGEEAIEFNLGTVFSHTNQDALQLGNAVHELFELCEWTETTEPQQVIDQWRQTCGLSPAQIEIFGAHFLHAWTCTEVQQVMARPEGEPLLWREKAFDLLLDKKWISGVFDRVVIIQDKSGHAESAQIIDFKTGDVPPEIYAPQLRLYRQALAKIIRLDEKNISTTLLYTEDGRAVHVDE